jgi:citronellol/citronellal dehydrogenase
VTISPKIFGLKGKTVIVTGSSRGIGRAIALRCAKEGANVVIASKTAQPHEKLEGTIHSVAREVEAAGGKALPIQIDVRQDADVTKMIETTVGMFGGVDILVNNAAAINLATVEQMELKRFDLINQVNYRGNFLCSQAALPYLKRAENPHILNISPPINLDPKWLGAHLAYTISKYAISMCTLGLAAEFKDFGIGVNSIWPKLLIETAATKMLLGSDQMAHTRKADIMSDAAFALFTTSSRELTGQLMLDEDYLKSLGHTNFEKYDNVPGAEIYSDLFL